MTHVAEDAGGMHAEWGVPIEGRVVSAPFPSAMELKQAAHDVLLGAFGLEDRFVEAVDERVGMVSDGSYGLAVDDQ